MSGGRVLLVLFSGLWVFSASVYAQSTSALPRLSDGKPNLQGIWDFRTLPPLQRPQEQDNAVLSVEEAAEIEARSAARTYQAFAPSDKAFKTWVPLLTPPSRITSILSPTASTISAS